MDGDDVAETYSEVPANDFVDSDFRLFTGVVHENDADSVATLLALQTAAIEGQKSRGKCLEKDGVSTEQLKVFHRLRVQSHHGIVVVNGVINDKTIGSFLSIQNSGTEIFLLR